MDIYPNLLHTGKNNKPKKTKKTKKPKGRTGQKPKNPTSPPDSDIDQSETPKSTKEVDKMNLNPSETTTSLALQT